MLEIIIRFGGFACLVGFFGLFFFVFFFSQNIVVERKSACKKMQKNLQWMRLQLLPKNTRSSLTSRMNYQNNRPVHFDRKDK